MLTQDRADMITKVLAPDYDFARKVLALDPGEALKQINALGHNFELDEIVTYREAFKAAAAKVESNPEISIEELDNVAGGIAPLVAGLIIGGGFVIGVINGALSKK